MIAEFTYVKSILGFFTNQLRLKYSNFYDIFILYLFGLWIMSKGLQEMINLLQKSIENDDENDFEKLFKYQTTKSPHKIAEL